MKADICLLMLLVLLSCNSDVKKNKECSIQYDTTIKLDSRSATDIKLSEIIDGYKEIRIETSKDCILSSLCKLEIYNDLIFIKDNVFPGIYIFNIDGTLKDKLHKQGRGPEEYLTCDDFILDKKAERLEILDKSNMKIMIYDLKSLKFVKNINIPLSFAFSFVKKDNYYYFQTNNAQNIIDGRKTRSSVIAYNINDNKVCELLHCSTHDKKENRFIEFNNIFSQNENGDITVSLAMSNSIYDIHKEKAIPSIKIDPCGRGIPNVLLKAGYDTRLDYLKKHDDINVFYKVLKKCGNNYVISYKTGMNGKNIMYFKYSSKNEIYHAGKIINDVSKFPKVIDNIFSIDNNSLYYVLWPSNYSGNSGIFEHYSISEYDNPVILKFNLKTNFNEKV